MKVFRDTAILPMLMMGQSLSTVPLQLHPIVVKAVVEKEINILHIVVEKYGMMLRLVNGYLLLRSFHNMTHQMLLTHIQSVKKIRQKTM